MASSERITVTLPSNLLHGIDARSRNRSSYVQKALRHEFERESQLKLKESLDSPHPATGSFEDSEYQAWFNSIPAEDTDFIDREAGVSVRWVAGSGWEEV